MSEEIKELQAEEKEALQSIYEGDSCFQVVNDTKYQYKVILQKFFLVRINFSNF